MDTHSESDRSAFRSPAITAPFFKSAVAGLFGLAAVLACATPALADKNGTGNGCNWELYNGYVLPVGNPTGFEYIFPGDVTGQLPNPLGTGSAGTNAFYANTQINNLATVNSNTANLNNNGDTVYVMSGSALDNPVPGDWPVTPIHYVGTTPTYHFGVATQGCATWTVPLDQYWLYPDGSSVEVPIPVVQWKGAYAKNDLLNTAVIYTSTQAGAGGWWGVTYAVSKSGTAKFTITNNTDVPISLGTTGYTLKGPTPPNSIGCQSPQACPGLQAAVDSLNEGVYPAPGEAGSPFTPVKTPKQALQPGQSFTFEAK